MCLEGVTYDLPLAVLNQEEQRRCNAQGLSSPPQKHKQMIAHNQAATVHPHWGVVATKGSPQAEMKEH
jgi:hypothetical protein